VSRTTRALIVRLSGLLTTSPSRRLLEGGSGAGPGCWCGHRSTTGQRLGDQVRHPGPRGPGGDVDREADHPALGPAVGDDHRPAHAEERRAPDPLVIEGPPDAADPRAHEEVRQAAAPGAPEL